MEMGGSAKSAFPGQYLSLQVSCESMVHSYPTIFHFLILTVIPHGCDKGSDSWNLDKDFITCAAGLYRAALCALPFTSGCSQFAKHWFSIFPQDER